MRNLAPILLFLALACTAQNRQEIDLTDRVVEVPEDGLGHYVYALALPERVAPGGRMDVQMDWRTVGPADGRLRYILDLRLDGPDGKLYTVGPRLNTVGEINLVNWFTHYLDVPDYFAPGTYALDVRLRDPETREPLVLGFVPEMAVGDGFYRVAEVTVVTAQ